MATKIKTTGHNYAGIRAGVGLTVVLGLGALGLLTGGVNETTPAELATMPHPVTVTERYDYCQSYRQAYDIEGKAPCVVAVFTKDD